MFLRSAKPYEKEFKTGVNSFGKLEEDITGEAADRILWEKKRTNKSLTNSVKIRAEHYKGQLLYRAKPIAQERRQIWTEF